MREYLRGAKLAAGVLVSAQILAAGGAVAVNLLAAVVLTPSGRGDLAFALQLAYFLSVFAIMGLERPFIAARAGGFGTEFRVFARMVAPGTLLILPVAFFAAMVSPFSTSWMWIGVVAIAVYVALNSLVHALRVAYVCSREWRWFALNAAVTQAIIVAAAGLLVLLRVNDPVVWMWAYVASALPTVLIFFLAPHQVKSAEPSRAEKKGLRRRGWVLLPADFSNTAMLRSDRLLLPMLSSSAALGLYVTVATVLEMATWPIQQWADASLRGWSKSISSGLLPAMRLLVRSLALLTVSATALGTAAYAMIVFVLPQTYQPAIAAIIPLGVSAVVFGMTRVQQGLLIAADASGSVTIVEIVGTAASLVAYVLLIPPFGMLGAAYGSIFGYAVCALFGAVALARALKGLTVKHFPADTLETIGEAPAASAMQAAAIADSASVDSSEIQPDSPRK